MIFIEPPASEPPEPEPPVVVLQGSDTLIVSVPLIFSNTYVIVTEPGVEGALNPHPGFRHPAFLTPSIAQ
jgi:hypothetical protein